MQSQYQSQSPIPDRADVPFETRRAVTEGRLSTQLAEVRQVGEDARKMKSIVEENYHQVVNLLGADKYEKLRAYVRDQRRYRAEYFFPSGGPEMSKDEVNRFRREQREKSEAFLRQLGVDPKGLRSLAERKSARIRELSPPHPTRDGKRVMILPPSQVPADIRAGKTNPWTLFSPPYASADGRSDGFADGFDFIPTALLDSRIGLVGNISYLRDSDASDNDYGYVKSCMTVPFWYQMPAAGLIEVWIEAISKGSNHRLSLFDEFGWSDSMVNQHNYLTLNASVGG